MAYYKKGAAAKKKWYQSLSIEGLERLCQDNSKKIEQLNKEIQNLDHSIAVAKALEQRSHEIWEESKRLPNHYTLLSRLLGGAEAARAKVRGDEIGREQTEISQKLKKNGDSKTLKERRQYKEGQRTELEQYNQANELRIRSLIEAAEKEERKRKNRELERAKLAQVDGRSRDLSQTIKKKLRKPEICPYCGNELVGVPHADHIFPVRYGGMSITENMVVICSACNMRKSDMTLREFCRKYGYDFQEIEKRLEKLGKKF